MRAMTCSASRSWGTTFGWTNEVAMHPKLGSNGKDRAGVVKVLNALLADEYVLYTKTRNYHWNVVGPQFNDLHKFFGEQYEAIDDFVDDVAERARTLGGHSV